MFRPSDRDEVSTGDRIVSYERMNGGRRASHPEADTRSRLIDAAVASVAEHGVSGATSRDIARRAGTNLQALTYHFGSKDDLVAQALLATFRGWIEPAVAALRGDGDPIVRMIGAVQALQASFEQSRNLLPAYLEALTHANRSDQLGAGVRELLADLRRFLASEIEALRSTGFLPAWIEPASMATLLLAAADGVALHAAMDPEAIDHHAVSSQAMQLLVAASSAAPASAAGSGPGRRSARTPRAPSGRRRRPGTVAT